jgi:hypothetical protein
VKHQDVTYSREVIPVSSRISLHGVGGEATRVRDVLGASE